jgi:CheY-like chemotaxis protein
MPDSSYRIPFLPNRRSFTAPGPSSELPPCNSQKSAPADNRDIHPSNILLACYRKNEREQLSALLRQKYNVTTCEDGHDALRRIAMANFDLLVTAITMPRMDGLELLRVLHCRRPGLPVIAVAEGTGIMDKIYLRSAASLGAIGTHTSPVSTAAFQANVDGILNSGANVRKEIV